MNVTLIGVDLVQWVLFVTLLPAARQILIELRRRKFFIESAAGWCFITISAVYCAMVSSIEVAPCT